MYYFNADNLAEILRPKIGSIVLSLSEIQGIISSEDDEWALQTLVKNKSSIFSAEELIEFENEIELLSSDSDYTPDDVSMVYSIVDALIKIKYEFLNDNSLSLSKLAVFNALKDSK